MNKKGFTLIELLAVIVILAVLALVASTNVFNILDNARRGSFRTEFLSLLEAAQTTAQIDMMNGKLTQKDNKICYSLQEGPLKDNYDNKNKYNGSVSVTLNATTGQIDMVGWLSGNYFTITGGTSSIENKEATGLFERKAQDTSYAMNHCGEKETDSKPDPKPDSNKGNTGEGNTGS